MKRIALLLVSSILSSTFGFVLPPARNGEKYCALSLAGLLDDYLSEGAASVYSESTEGNEEFEMESVEHQDLFHSLIFSGDTRADIAMQLDKCADSKFSEYLSATLEKSKDEEERQGLQELMDLISEVVEETNLQEQQKIDEMNLAAAENAKMQERLQNEAKARAGEPTKTMSNSDVVKQANVIDEAVMTDVMSDDEKPSDFISDCREVVNLSRGFNDQGRMSVGGR